MKTLLLSNEYPPHIYGGAGIHIDYLSRELSKLMKVDVKCFGNQIINQDSLKVRGYNVARDRLANAPEKLRSSLGALLRCVDFNLDNIDADVVHCHTWYTHIGGVLTKLLYNIPLVVTTHSLEPLRPWKEEQLGRAYTFSSWVEKTTLEMADAVIAVSGDTKEDILDHFDIPSQKVHIIPNGIDIDEYQKTGKKDALVKYKIPLDQDYVLFVGRITRQKGIIHLLDAIEYIDPSINVVLCAGTPDTDEIAKEMNEGFDRIKTIRNNVYWIDKMLNLEEKIQFYSNASVFCCPSIYEPFGIINLEAMACKTPVVASSVGGIKEIIEHGKTGLLIPFAQRSTPPFEPINPAQFARDLAAGINQLVKDKELNMRMGEAGRKTIEDKYSWTQIAKMVYQLYTKITGAR